MKGAIKHIREGCVAMGHCPVSLNNLEAMEERIAPTLDPSLIPLLDQMLVNLHLHVGLELQDKMFLFLPSADAALFKDAQPFGDAVWKAFPGARREIEEAAKCLSLDRPTAAVCHLARCLEVAMRALMKHVNATPPKLQNWFQVIDAIEKRIKELEQTHPEKAPDHAAYARMAETFDHVRTGWRNDAMHAGEFYYPSEARSFYDSVRLFMEALAARYSEADPGTPSTPPAGTP